MQHIQVYNPLFLGNEKKYLQECIDSGWVSSDGPFVQRFEEAFAEWSGNRYAIAICNGTAALETAIWALDVREIFIPNSTIISCAIASTRVCDNSYIYQNYLSQNNYIGIHENYKIEKPTSYAYDNILKCHLFGYYNNAYSNGLYVEDASQYWKPFKVKDIACYSLYANKLITCGEGGVVVTNNKKYYERAKAYRNLCHTKERFIHWDKAYNFRMSNLQAAVALAQLECIDRFTEIKQRNRDLYKKYLRGVKILFDVEIPWMYLIWVKSAKKVVKEMHNKGIECRRFFYPIWNQGFWNRSNEISVHNYNSMMEDIEYGIDLWEHLVYLPSGLTLTGKEIEYICKTLKNTLNSTI